MVLCSRQDYVNNIASRIDTSMQTIRQQKNVEARDRFIMERNFERVNFWSAVHVFVMLSVALVQILTIRSLFTDKSGTPGTTKVRT